MRHRAVEGRAAVWQIVKRRAYVRRPLLSVGLITQQWRGSVWWAVGQGMNQPPKPTAAAYQTHKGRLFSPLGPWRQRRSKGAADASFRGGGGDVCETI